MSGLARGAAMGLALLLVGGCAYADLAERVKRDLVGMRGRDLRGCIGLPESVDVVGDLEYLTYRWDVVSTRDGPAISATRGAATRPDRFGSGPQVATGGASLSGVGYCELVFELAEGVVRRVEVEGRTPHGLNWDAGCALTARRCLPADR